MKSKKICVNEKYLDFVIKQALDKYSASEGEKLEKLLCEIDEPQYSEKFRKKIQKNVLNYPPKEL